MTATGLADNAPARTGTEAEAVQIARPEPGVALVTLVTRRRHANEAPAPAADQA